MQKNVNSAYLKTQIKEIARLRSEELLCWRAVGLKLIEMEVKTGHRSPDDLRDTSRLARLVHGYSRSCARLYDTCCVMGLFTPPPAGTRYRDTEDSTPLPKSPTLLARLGAMSAASEQAELDPEVGEDGRQWHRTRLRSERRRLQNMVRRAEQRVRHGRPFVTGVEAKTCGNPGWVWDWETRGYVKSPYPAISDRELLGDARYNELIAERVKETMADPKHTEADLFRARNPELLPLPKARRIEDFWWDASLAPGDVAVLQEAKRALLTLGLLSTVVYERKPGRVAIGSMSLDQMVSEIVDWMFGHPDAIFVVVRERHEQARNHSLTRWLRDAVRNSRERIGFSKPLHDIRKARLVRFMELHAEVTSAVPCVPLDGEKPSGEAYHEWLESMWPTLLHYLREHPDFNP
jgi:hypothetical protein